MDKITVYLRTDQNLTEMDSKKIEYSGKGLDFNIMNGELYITLPKLDGDDSSRSRHVAHWVQGSWSGFEVSADGLTVSRKAVRFSA